MKKIPIYSSICLRPLRKQKQNSKQRKPTLTSPSTSRNSACLHLKNFRNPIEMVLCGRQCLEYGTARTTLPLMATHCLRQNRQRICGCCWSYGWWRGYLNPHQMTRRKMTREDRMGKKTRRRILWLTRIGWGKRCASISLMISLGGKCIGTIFIVHGELRRRWS